MYVKEYIRNQKQHELLEPPLLFQGFYLEPQPEPMWNLP